MDRLKAMANFVRIVECGSLSAAANATGQSVASLVRSLAALERYLGVRLLNRTTRRIALTDDGEHYLAWSRRMLADFDDIEQRLAGRDGKVQGLLRLTAPVEFGQRHVAPIVNAFLREHPGMRVDLRLSDRIIPLLDERLDVALRIGLLPDSGMVARQVGVTRLVTCASADYLRAAPPLDRPEALRDHACIALASQGQHWFYRHGEKASGEKISPKLVCNQVRTASLACVQGIGVARLMHYQVAEELLDARLIRVLRDFEPVNIPIQLVYPHTLQRSPRVKVFVEWACRQLENLTPRPDARTR
ncbi:LysR family transcriptional regulator [Robbsia sp. Bb-Pol-6]|uniref:LysR family transcriptional regulator n=1 Tax=Robbsia betulipollinis TaxID=2981849 RepID=A0ABT3ZK59_9BURK|nr:LysR family transcriptional regulator [Robbsia betulipollinis]MCY0386670.1 LysR family transcriptional regulator [Robbsia betulipollinis]